MEVRYHPQLEDFVHELLDMVNNHLKYINDFHGSSLNLLFLGI